MHSQQFSEWFEILKDIWEKRTPNRIVDICAEKFIWYETPFDKPIITKKELLNEWQGVLNQQDIRVSYEILSINENIGIAHWNATFTRLPSKEKSELDGIFKISLDSQGRCIEFRQWFNSKPH